MKKTIFFTICLLFICSCSKKIEIPTQFTDVKDSLAIYPDYVGVTIPPNIAPLNFMAKSEAKAFACSVSGNGIAITAGAEEDGKIIFDADEWRNLLTHNKGKQLEVALYSQTENGWQKHPSFHFDVAQEEIDPYLSYRLIEPSYELYRQLGLYQRDLTSFEEWPIYENNRTFDEQHNHCVNCHNYQNYSTDRMLFHVRAKHGGTIFFDHGKLKKMNMLNDSVLSNCVYPSWHPSRNWVVFSSNLTGQAFHIKNKEKIEVLDYGSDLVFYDADKGTLTNIIKTDTDMETFPCWAPDGKKIYYCRAHFEPFKNAVDSTRSDSVLRYYTNIHYDVMSISFDEQTRTFGEPQTEVDCTSMGMSATVPRVSPDGRFLLFTMGNFGQFHIWHRNSDQWIKNLQTGEIYPLTAANSPEVDSYHTWSSNGRWIVFSSRREDANFTRPAIAYIDNNGQPRKAFILPQEDPEYHMLFFKSYNVPELTRNKVQTTPEQLKEVIYNDEAVEKVKYKANK